MNWKRTINLAIMLLTCLIKLQAQEELKKQLETMLGEIKAQVGAAIVLDGKDTLTLGNDFHYPMMSVFKFHQALAVANWLQQHGQTLDMTIRIEREDLKANTYSPLRDRYPEGGISMPVREMLTYTLQQSDNNACDILFRLTGGTAETDFYIRSLGITDFAITATEDEMHQDFSLCYTNWSTPLAAAQLLETFLAQDTIHNKTLAFIHRTMTGCKTGTDRLAQPLLGTKSIIGHKTGTGGPDAQGKLIGINDIGFVYLPNGHRYTIAVFVTNSEEGPQATARIIARISETVYRYMLENCD